MFTGIIEELGLVKSVQKESEGIRLSVQADNVFQDCCIGDSICVNGVCLTAVKVNEKKVEFDLLAETANRTNLGLLNPGDKVNLERSLKAGQRLSGHFVSGHVDGTGALKYSRTKTSDLALGIKVDKEILKFISFKGSVAIEGVSLTVSDVNKVDKVFEVSIIPHTAKITTLGLISEGTKVNIEVDMLARYIYNFLNQDKGRVKAELTSGFLSEHGFM
ncbi:MAG: riboflavin synthase [Candidatus Omnitrophica bacterium]|nr:riboflavin synthase [Candidatus Omnitrophota bacterium]